MKKRLDEEMAEREMVFSRSQAQRLIKLGKVKADGTIIKKQHYMVSPSSHIEITGADTYVSRAGFKLESVADEFNLTFKNLVVLDVGSSTGGFTDYALKRGAKKVIAVDVGTNQLHPSLRGDERVELHEQTDIRDIKELSTPADIVVIDVSFISLREVLPHIATLVSKTTNIVAMLKPQFEVGDKLKNKGVIKNDTLRRRILKDFENWAKPHFLIKDKKDSDVSGQKGNLERFYLLLALKK